MMKRFIGIIVLLGCWLVLYAQTSVDAEQIIQTARLYIGRPYKYGSTGPNSFDCSGFVQFCFSKHGIRLPRSSDMQAREGILVSGGWDKLQTGDLVFFGIGKISHVGIYVGALSANKHTFIHASTSSGVTISVLEEQYWKSRFKYAKRLSLVASEPIVIPKTKSSRTQSANAAATAPQSAIGDAAAHAQMAIDDVVPYKSKRWKTKVNHKNRVKVVLKEE